MFIREFDVSKLFRIDVGLRRRGPLLHANGLEYVRTATRAQISLITAFLSFWSVAGGKGTEPVQEQPARPAAVGIHVPDYNQSLSSFPDAARTWYYVSSPMFTSR